MATKQVEQIIVEVKPEIIEISDEETDLNGKKRKKRIKKKPDQSKYVQCEHCSKMFGTRSQLRKHLLIHTGERPFVCTECGKSYRQSHHLRTHELTHVDSGQVKNFTCAECGSTFTRKSSLKTHEKIHTGVKPYTCHICPKSFVQKTNLVYHIKVHEDDRKFECTLCRKKFMTNSKMRQHMKKHEMRKLKSNFGVKRKKNHDFSDSDEDISVSTSPVWGSQRSEDSTLP